MFTKTDMYVLGITSILIIIIFIYAYLNHSNMTASDYNTILTVVATLGSGIVASFATIKLSNRREKKEKKERINKTTLIFITLLQDIYITNFKDVFNKLDSLYEVIDNDQPCSYKVPHMTFNDIDIFTFIEKELLLDIFISKKIDINKLYEFFIMLEFHKKENAEKIITDFDAEIEYRTKVYEKDIQINNKKTMDLLQYKQEYYNEIHRLRVSFKARLAEYSKQCKISIKDIEDLLLQIKYQ